MKNVWVVVLVAVLVAIVLACIAALVPAVRVEVVRLMATHNWPVWLAAVCAPLVWLGKRLAALPNAPDSTKGVVQENAAIRAEQTALRQQVSDLVAWRDQEFQARRAEIGRLQDQIIALRANLDSARKDARALRETNLDQYIGQLQARGEGSRTDELVQSLGGKEYE